MGSIALTGLGCDIIVTVFFLKRNILLPWYHHSELIDHRIPAAPTAPD